MTAPFGLGPAATLADLARRAEEACLAAWPAPRQLLMDGWLLRFAGGHTSRANSVNVVGPSRDDAAAKLAACDALYRAQGLRPILRLSSAQVQPDLAPALDAAGYGPPRDPSLVLHADLAPSRTDGGGATLGKADGRDRGVGPTRSCLDEGRPGAAWRAASDAAAGLDGAGAAWRGRILDSFAVPVAFASVEVDGEVAATALGAVHGGLVCLNAVATAARHRGRGLAARAVSALLAWAAERQGATGACLQVDAGNAPALALYGRLGFTAELSRYHYRDAPRP